MNARMLPMALLLAGTMFMLPAQAADETAAAPAVGTTIVGERDAAVGLYLLPWREETRSDLDRPPLLYRGAKTAIDAQHFAARVASDEAEAAHRRMRAEPPL